MLLTTHRLHKLQARLILCVVAPAILVLAQSKQKTYHAIDISAFQDSQHHWYDIQDEDRVIIPLPDQRRYDPSEITRIADNVLLFQKSNGGWPKNYDMLAVLTDEQKEAVLKAKDDLNTTFDNGATHAQVEYMARVYLQTRDDRYREACERGLDFILSAQYPNGGWPQFFPDLSGYRKFITFNDGAMIGIMGVLHRIVQCRPEYAFLDTPRSRKVREAFKKGIACILKTQIVQSGKLTAWGQQHDNIDLRPQSARTFEPAAASSLESSEIVLFLMSIDKPGQAVIRSVRSAVKWFEVSRIRGVRYVEVDSPLVKYQYHSAGFDRVIVKDPKAPPIWARFYELGTNRPLFCNRDGKPVYSLMEVDRERRTGYAWYTYAPDEVLRKYSAWLRKHEPDPAMKK